MNVLRPIQNNYYGDDHRWFVGTVVNNHPPPGLEGRVKVRITGVHSPSTGDIPEVDLPWAQVIVPTTEGGLSGIGKIPQLVPGAFVFGIFLDGVSSQLPLVLGSMPRQEFPSPEQAYNQLTQTNIAYAAPFLGDDTREADPELRRNQCMKFFIDNGYTPIQAAALTGNLDLQSRFILYDNPDGRIGIAGWESKTSVGSRYLDLVDFAGSLSPRQDWKLLSTQLQFIVFELRNRFSITNGKLVRSGTIKDASEIVAKYYLKTSRNAEEQAQLAYDGVYNV